MRWIAFLCLPFLCSIVSSADAPSAKEKSGGGEVPRIPPRTPEEEARSFEIDPRFRIELAAAEPLVESPVAAEFDEDGRLFVVEFPEYNQYASKKPHGKGRIVMLEDTDGDGKFDKRTVVVDHLNYPTALFPWDGGIYFGAAPHLIYWKDNQQTIVLTGFGSDRAGEGQLNSFRWGLDNRIHISTGLDGGEISRPGANKDQEPVNVRGLNLLLDPRTNQFETTSGGGQHGMSMDDWGNTFVCGNSDPCQHLVYDTRYLARNPAVNAPPPIVSLAPDGKYTTLHRISEVEPWRRLRTSLRKQGIVPGSDEGGRPSGFFTGASGVTIYRGDAYPEEFRGNAFVGEVANNLVFRAKLVPKGVSFVAEHADPEREFLASKDIWFRPVQFFHGPDGCLYVLDMYRELIEGAAFLAPQILKFVDPSAGFDKGRIWRIAPKDFKRPRPPRLGTATTDELVKLLDHRDGWRRDTAARLLYARQDPKAVAALKKQSAEAKTPQGRVHALYALAGINESLKYADLLPRFSDSDAHVRVAAVRLAEELQIEITNQTLDALAEDVDPMVRYQLAWSLYRVDDDASALAIQKIVALDRADRWARLAVLCTATGSSAADGLLDFIQDPNLRKSAEGRAFIEALVETAGAGHKRNAVAAVRGITRLRDDDVAFQFHLVSVLCRRASTQNLRYFQFNPGMRDLFAQLHERARELAEDHKADEAARAAAISSLRTVPYSELSELFPILLKPNQPVAVQVAALELLGLVSTNEAPGLLLKIWPSLSPAVRATATEVFLSRSNWVQAFLDAVEEKKIARADIDPARIELLRKSPSRAIRIRVDELFTRKLPGNRKEVVEQYQKALALSGNAMNGKAVFKKSCSACHKLEDVGQEVGADLKAIRDRGIENMLLHILDPNREVKPQYLAYQLQTKSGKAFTGMVTAETPNAVTIRMLDGRSEVVPRAEIENLRSTGLSFMPEGLEQQIDLQAMADLLAYLNSIK